MDSSSYHEIDTVKMEKQKAMQRYLTFKKIGNFLRTLEIVVAITLVSYSISFTSSYLPPTVDFAGAFFRRISHLLFSPHFVFLVGNVIIITLYAKSSRDENNKASENVGGVVGDVDSVAADENVSVSTPVVVIAEVPAVMEEKEKEEETEEKVYRRTKSTANMVVMKVVEKAEKKALRRSETEVRRKVKSPRRRGSVRFEVDELSNEEFRRKVEAFIEKQQRFLRDEKLAVVLSN